MIRKIGIRTCFQFFLLITRLLKGALFYHGLIQTSKNKTALCKFLEIAEPNLAFSLASVQMLLARFACLPCGRRIQAFVANSQPGVDRKSSKSSEGPGGDCQERQPNDVQQLLAAGQAAQDQGRFEEAVRTYNRVIALSSNQPRTAAIANFRLATPTWRSASLGTLKLLSSARRAQSKLRGSLQQSG